MKHEKPLVNLSKSLTTLQAIVPTTDYLYESDTLTSASPTSLTTGQILPADFFQPLIGLIIIAVNFRWIYKLSKRRHNVQVTFLYLMNLGLSDVVFGCMLTLRVLVIFLPYDLEVIEVN